MAVAATAETHAAQVGCCSLAVPSPGAGWLECILASHAGSVPVLQQLQPSQEHEAEPSAYKVRESPGWLSKGSQSSKYLFCSVFLLLIHIA